MLEYKPGKNGGITVILLVFALNYELNLGSDFYVKHECDAGYDEGLVASILAIIVSLS